MTWHSNLEDQRNPKYIEQKNCLEYRPLTNKLEQAL